MSETPRTDANIEKVYRGAEVTRYVRADFARQLERELVLAEAKLTYLRSTRTGEIGEKLYRLEREVAEYRVALEKIAHMDLDPVTMKAIARHALASKPDSADGQSGKGEAK